VYVGAYAIDDYPSVFRSVLASIVDRESFNKQCQQLDSATRDYLNTRLDYYQIKIEVRQFRASPSLILVHNYRNIKVTVSKSNDSGRGFIWDANIHKYTVTVDASIYMKGRVGFARSKLVDVSAVRFYPYGWCLCLHNGCLWPQNGDSRRAYSTGCKVGDAITCIYNSSSSEISFEINGVSLGVAFINVNGEDIAPACEFYTEGDRYTLTTE
jgi:SPRY domain